MAALHGHFKYQYLPRRKTVTDENRNGIRRMYKHRILQKYKHYEMFTINVFGKFNKIDELLTDVMNLENFGEKSLTPTPTMAIETAELIVKTLAKLMDEQFQPGSRALGNW
ncbi:hypothetical protein BZA77DRAFT_356830 [Pyronema omphalodes]|nr:hypothetical protein BZA77DRAFT_356830 [Pyronema omphalodes]